LKFLSAILFFFLINNFSRLSSKYFTIPLLFQFGINICLVLKQDLYMVAICWWIYGVVIKIAVSFVLIDYNIYFSIDIFPTIFFTFLESYKYAWSINLWQFWLFMISHYRCQLRGTTFLGIFRFFIVQIFRARILSFMILLQFYSQHCYDLLSLFIIMVVYNR